MKKAVILKWFLRFSAVLQIIYWGLSHLFFPKWYLRSIGMAELARNPGSTLLFVHEIGILTLGIGVATWLASRDPVKNFNIIVMLYIVSLGSIGISLYHILVKMVATGEWITILLIAVQLAIVTFLFPWKALKK